MLAIQNAQLTIPVRVQNHSLDMVVDTGSPVSILPRWAVSGDLEKSERELCGYGGSQFQVLGTCDVTMLCKGMEAVCIVYVVPFGRPIMGLDLMEVFAVNVVDNSVCTVSQPPSSPDPPEQPKQSEPQPGQPPPPILGFQHRVTVNPSVTPVQQPLRRLPWAVRDEVSARLDQLERDGIIEKVEASEWVSPLVVGRKRDGGVRLCVDMRDCQRRYFLTTVRSSVRQSYDSI